MEPFICPLFKNASDAPALITPEKTWSYRDLHRAVSALCQHLEQQGITEGSKVAFIAHNTPASILLFFALFRIGAIACPLSHRIPDAQIGPHLEKLSATRFLNQPPLIESGPDSEPLPIPSNRLATFLFTSGSTASPKVACHSFGNHYYNAIDASTALNVSPRSRWLLSLPLFHVGGIAILFRCFVKGAAVVLTTQPLIKALSEAITHISLVPTQLFRLLSQEIPAHTLECMLVGGAPLPSPLIHRAGSLELPLFLTYGMTEMSSITALTPLNSSHMNPLPSCKWKLSEEGEILVKGKTLFQGYWNAENGTLLKPEQEGWFPTKDLGRHTSEGNLQWSGRKDRQFISGGENIQPEEIEQALLQVASIRSATVLPISDEEFGMRPIAFIDDTSGTHTLESIRAALKSELPSFKHPICIKPYPSHLLEKGIKISPAQLKEYLTDRLTHSIE